MSSPHKKNEKDSGPDNKDLVVRFFSKHNMSDSNFLYLKTALQNSVNIFLRDSGDTQICFTVTKNWNDQKPADISKEDDINRKSKYIAIEPDSRYTLERLVLPHNTKQRILSTLCVFQHQDIIFDKWQLGKIASPMVALSFEGEPGTGKTMAAHAIAHYLGKKIILASYAQIESMYHGEGPKNVQAIFEAAMSQDALLFVDDAESLLSKRLANVTTGSENAINSMRDQFLICLEQFKGLVVFASNKAESYDPALETRLWTIHFDLPNEEQRCEIWRQHLPEGFPTTATPEELAKIEGVCGREIRSAVIEVAATMVYESTLKNIPIEPASTQCFQKKMEEIIQRRKAQISEPKKESLSPKTKQFLAENAKSITDNSTERGENVNP